MKRVVGADEMRRYEQARFADGRAESLVWMERAAQGVDKLLSARYAGKRLLVVCGGGNNGETGSCCFVYSSIAAQNARG